MSGSTTSPGNASSPPFDPVPEREETPLAEEIRSRPFVLAFFAIAVGMSCAFAWWHAVFLIAVMTWLRDRRSLLILGIVGVVGILLRPEPPVLIRESRPFQGQLEVISMPAPSPLGYQMLTSGSDGRYVLRCGSDEDISFGDVVYIQGLMQPVKEYEEPAHGARAVIQMVGKPVHLKQGLFLWRWGRGMRESFDGFVSRAFSEKDAGLLNALCFSTTADLEPELRANLRRSGLSHVVAASGMHVWIAAVAVFWLLMRLPIDRRWQLFLLMFVLIVYAGAAGLRASIVRAIIMAAIALTAWLFKREPDGLSAVSAAGSASLLVDPETLLDIGFLLSYSAVLGMVLFMRAPDEKAKGWRMAWPFLKANIETSLVAGLATLPVIAYVFGEIPTAGLLANLLVVPLVLIGTVGALAGWLVGFVIPGLGVWIIQCTGLPFVRWMEYVANTLGRSEYAVVPIPWFSAYWIVVLWAVAFAIWRSKIREA